MKKHEWCKDAFSSCKSYLALSTIAFLMLGCGSGSNNAKVDTESSANTTTVGHITIEEKSGKRVFDAWFSNQASLSATNHDSTTVWQASSQFCAQKSDSVSRDTTGAVFDWQSTIDVGDELRFSSRTDTVFSLVPQRFGNAVTYAANERWLASAIPADTVLSIEGPKHVQLTNTISIQPLESIVQTHPLNGAMVHKSETLQWEVSAATDDAIEIELLQKGSSSNIYIVCYLDDTGSFQLPDALLALFSEESSLMVYMTRIRQQRYEQEDLQLLVSQTSLSY